MIWKEIYGDYSKEAVLKFLTDKECREALKEKMAEIERKRRLLSVQIER
jgi:hypothetical protein